jgi:hypothetical protein
VVAVPWSNIEQALIAAGMDLDHLQPADLALVEDFHTMGGIAMVVIHGLTSRCARGDLQTVQVDDLFDYEPGWGLPGPADIQALTALMAG